MPTGPVLCSELYRADSSEPSSGGVGPAVRLYESVTAAPGGVEASAFGLDALELTRAGADWRTLGCGIGHAEIGMAEKDDLRPGGTYLGTAIKRAFQKSKSDDTFGQVRSQPKIFGTGIYPSDSAEDEQTLTIQNPAVRRCVRPGLASLSPNSSGQARGEWGWSRDNCGYVRPLWRLAQNDLRITPREAP
jgi:hypothetical protein